MDDPTTLEGDELHDWIASHLSYKHNWGGLMHDGDIMRVRDSVDGLMGTLEGQLALHAHKPESEEWRLRAEAKLNMCQKRLTSIDLRLERSGAKGAVQHLKDSMHEVLEVVLDEGSDEMWDAMFDIEIKCFRMSVGDWFNRRMEKREDA